ncbi:hypothetical protein KOR42_37400 [Thalassoglobus neptunius]|uniref:Competence protein A n=1 Tax=Thalassoglobus neptunius TaxID=1938619 RepID=A0A5C5WJA2_9PLAN|nr:hypothetical protein [Thalassoglobus neptunius]TWT49922.1 hypothetical protein KOR42_37400 [Thalassoglobus neptunius]
MTVALDLGCSEFRSYRRVGKRLIARRTPSLFCSAPDDIEIHEIASQSRIPYSVAESSLVFLGKTAVEIAPEIGRPLSAVFRNGYLPEKDPVARQVLSILIETLLPPATHPDERCGVSIPASAGRRQSSKTNFIHQLLSLRGYHPLLLDPATALAISELASSNMTGLTVVVGAESVAFALMHRGRSVFHSQYSKGFREIGQRFATEFHQFVWDQNGTQFLDLEAASRLLPTLKTNSASEPNNQQKWLAKSIFDLIFSAWNAQYLRLFRELDDPVFREELQVVYTGGPTHFEAFPDLLRAVFQNSAIPISIGMCRPSRFAPYGVARGLLVHAELDSNLIKLNRQIA